MNKKKKWLEAIGMENIKPNVKYIYICSLHFDDKCFYKILDVTRLRDDAVPFKSVRQHASQHKTGILKENQSETIEDMSDVAQGGATVFPELGLTLYLEKGAAAFWLNLHPSGQVDLAAKHTACPVLLGSKWVCNKWIHDKGQELIKPCNLEYQDEIILRSIPRPTLKNLKGAGQN